MKVIRRKSLVILLVVAVSVAALFIAGCAFGVEGKGVASVGKDGTRAGNNMWAGTPAGDHSTGNGSGESDSEFKLNILGQRIELEEGNGKPNGNPKSKGALEGSTRPARD